MKLIIDIPEEEYNHLKRTNDYSIEHTRYIYNGIPLDEMRDEFIKRYPRNYAGELELGGRSCVFSLNEVLRIIDKYKEGI